MYVFEIKLIGNTTRYFLTNPQKLIKSPPTAKKGPLFANFSIIIGRKLIPNNFLRELIPLRKSSNDLKVHFSV